MDQKVFEKLASIAHEVAGINLKEGKEALVAARVAKRLRHLNLPDEHAYLKYLQEDETGEEMSHYIDVISTNFTSFNRETDHFKYLANWIRDELPPQRKKLSIWSCASSSGEEPYTIAITVLDALGGRNVEFKMLATDISTNALAKARLGRYEAHVVAPLTLDQRNQYFEKKSATATDCSYQVKPEVKDRIKFLRLNLANPPFPMQGPFDIIFCRNVMIYFDNDTRQGLISECERLLAAGGILFTAHSETLAGVRSGFRMVRPSIYRQPGLVSGTFHKRDEVCA